MGLDDGQRRNSVGGRGLHGGEEKGQMKVRSQAKGMTNTLHGENIFCRRCLHIIAGLELKRKKRKKRKTVTGRSVGCGLAPGGNNGSAVSKDDTSNATKQSVSAT